MDGDYQFLIKQHITHCSGCGYLCKRSLRNFPWHCGGKRTGTIKKLFVDDVDSLELLLAHSVPEGIANLLIPLVIYVAMFLWDWKLALMSLASIPISLLSMVIMYSVGMKRMGPYKRTISLHRKEKTFKKKIVGFFKN